jgi:hypothetical protein
MKKIETGSGISEKQRKGIPLTNDLLGNYLYFSILITKYILLAFSS